MIFKDDEWISICELDAENEIRFTKEYLALTGCLGWGARKFAAQLITFWSPEFQGLLDWFGSPDKENDEYSGIDGEPMNIKEDVMDVWEYKDIPVAGLDAEWHGDILRSKLVSIKLPKKLITKYVEAVKKDIGEK